MEIEKIFNNDVDGIADNIFGTVNNSVSEVREMQKKKVAENVQLVIQALKKIETDIRDQFNGVSSTLEKRISTIKDGKNGINGRDGRDGKDGKPGKDGKDGRPGRDGMPGKPGMDGKDGVGVSKAYIDFDGSLIICLTDGQEINVGEVVAPDLAESIKVITNGGGTSQTVLDTLVSLQNQINTITALGAVSYQGTWNASTNTPTITSGAGTKGYYYVVSVAGTTSIDSETKWGVGDWIIFNGTSWQKVDGGDTGDFTNLNVSGTMNLSGKLANTVLFLNASKNVTSDSSFVYNESTQCLGLGSSSPIYKLEVKTSGSVVSFLQNTAATSTTPFAAPIMRLASKGSGADATLQFTDDTTYDAYIGAGGGSMYFALNNATELMRLTSTGLGIGTSSPAERLTVAAGGTDRVGASVSGAVSTLLLGNQNASTACSSISFDRSIPAMLFNVGVTGAITERMRLDSSGNLGLGVTPSAWGTSKAIQIRQSGTPSFFANVLNSDELFLGRNAYYNGSNFIYTSSGTYATAYQQASNGSHIWQVAASGTAGNAFSFTQAMTLDASGRLGIGGVTSPGYTLDIGGTSGTLVRIGTNSGNGSTDFWPVVVGDGNSSGGGTNQNFIRIGRFSSGVAGIDAFQGGVGDAPLAFGTYGTERARIDSSGNLFVGTTSATIAGDRVIEAKSSGTTRIESTSTGRYAVFNLGAGTAGANTTGYMYVDDTSNIMTVYASSNTPLLFGTNNTERARIDSSGNLLVGTTTNSASSGGILLRPNSGGNGSSASIIGHTSGTSSGDYYSAFVYDASVIGSITQSGTTAVAYNTSSDYRLKDNPQPLTGSGAFIDALKPKTWQWKADGSRGVGFIAHEVQEVSPGSVVGEKDAVDEDGKPIMQAMEYGSAEFIANIIAELQSLRARVAQLESK